RSAWNAHWTSEVRFGMSSGNVVFSDAIQPPLFAPWGGYSPNLGLQGVTSYVQNPSRRNTSSRRNNPVHHLSGSASWAHKAHLVNIGGSFSRINEWQQAFSTQNVPIVNFGVSTSDPAGFGATNIFTAANFPASQNADLTNAQALYSILTGRIS